MTSVMYVDYLKTLLRIEIAVKIEEPEEEEMDNVSYSSPEQNLNQNVRSAGLSAEANMRNNGAGAPPKPSGDKPQTYVKNKDDIFANVGRNDPCPCGSGKKFKKCHGA